MEIEDLYGKVQNLFQAGQLEKAVALAKERSTKSRNEARFHLRWADLLEELGLFDEVILELNFAIRDDPESQDTYRRLSEIYLDNGYPGKAARCYWSIIKQNPAKATNYKQLGQILEEEGDYEKALKVYNVGYEKTGDEVFKALIRSLDFLGSEETLEVAVETTDHIIPAQHNLVTFTTLFAGREGVYARQWVSPTGETGYTPVHEPLTLKATENHILGNMTAGIYPIRLDNTVNFIAFDLDLPKFVVNKTITRESLWKKAIEKAIRDELLLAISGTPVEITMIVTSNLDYPDVITTAMESKRKREIEIKEEAAKQAMELLRVDNRLKIAQKMKITRAAEAEAEATYNLVMGKSLTPEYLRLREIEAKIRLYDNIKDGDKIIITDGASPVVPLINLDSASK